MKLLTLIQHTSKRNRYLDLVLNYAIVNQTDNYSIVTDDVNSRSGMLNCFKTGLESDATHYLILQDDILPSKDLIKTAEHLIEIKPNEIISLFSAQPVIQTAMSIQRHWVTIDRLYGLCAYIIPSFMAKDYVDNFVDNIKDSIMADDVCISIYLDLTKRKAWLTAPSLVDHIAWDRSSQHKVHIPQKNAETHRIANRYIGFEESGLSINWDKGLIDPVDIKIGGEYDHIRHLKKI